MCHRVLALYLFLLIVSICVEPGAFGQNTDNALPIIHGNIQHCSCNGSDTANGCLSPSASVCQPGCTPNGQEGNDACQPLPAQCQGAPTVTHCTESIPTGRYRLKLDMKLDSGERDCMNSRTQDAHHRLQQIGCTADVDQSTFYLDQKDAQGCYTLRPAGQSPNTVLGILVDNDNSDNKYIAEMGMKPNCQAGADQYHWNLVKFDIPSGTRYQIQNKLTGECINADRNSLQGGGKVQPLHCVDDAAELFELQKVQ